jgi:hypothetical protein
VDRAATKALARATRAIDRPAVSEALRSVYLPWLDQGATALQELVRTGNVKLAGPDKLEVSKGTILSSLMDSGWT